MESDGQEIVTIEEPDYNAFYLEMGRCIASWSDAESRLFAIFQICANTDERRAAIFFDKTPTLDSRLQLTDETIRNVPEFSYQIGDHPHKLLKRWDVLRANMNELKTVRNAICHHPVFTLLDSPDLKELPITVHIEITPTKMQYLRNKHKDSIKIEDLKEHFKKLSQLRGDLVVFMNDYLTYFRTNPSAKA